MNVLGWMIIGSLASALAIVTMLDGASARAVVAGMIGPLLSAGATWIMIDRTLRANPAALTPRLLVAFLVKAVLYLLYVFVAVKILAVSAKPFAISFTAYFIVLHQIEAVLLRRRTMRATHIS
jgi:hypothetical protein